MRGVLEANDLAHLQVQVSVDDVVVEHAAGLEEVAVLIEIGESLAKAAAHSGDLLQLLRRQIVKVLVGRLSGTELVLNPVKAGHQHRREAEIRIAQRVWITDFDSLALGRGGERNAAAGCTVTNRIGE